MMVPFYWLVIGVYAGMFVGMVIVIAANWKR